MIINEVFGEIEFDYTWYKEEEILFNEKKEEIVLLIAGDEDGEFEQGQYEAYTIFRDKWHTIQKNILPSILEYYNARREELGYDVEINTDYPYIENENVLLKHITLVGVKVPYADIYGGRSIGLSFDCSWDDENGLGIRLNNEEVIDVGFQDIAI